jgi:hypothetical protein
MPFLPGHESIKLLHTLPARPEPVHAIRATQRHGFAFLGRNPPAVAPAATIGETATGTGRSLGQPLRLQQRWCHPMQGARPPRTTTASKAPGQHQDKQNDGEDANDPDSAMPEAIAVSAEATAESSNEEDDENYEKTGTD